MSDGSTNLPEPGAPPEVHDGVDRLAVWIRTAWRRWLAGVSVGSGVLLAVLAEGGVEATIVVGVLAAWPCLAALIVSVTSDDRMKRLVVEAMLVVLGLFVAGTAGAELLAPGATHAEDRSATQVTTTVAPSAPPAQVVPAPKVNYTG